MGDDKHADEEGVRAGQLQHRVHAPEIVVEDLGATGGQLENRECLPNTVQQAPSPCCCHRRPHTFWPIHDDSLIEGLVYGHVAVIGYHCQEKDPGAFKEMEKNICVMQLLREMTFLSIRESRMSLGL